MPELPVKEIRLPELHLPEINREQIVDSLSGRLPSVDLPSVELPSFGIRLTLQPLLRDQELVTRGSTAVRYCYGAVSVHGSFGGVAVSGDGYVEMTGYDRAFKAP